MLLAICSFTFRRCLRFGVLNATGSCGSPLQQPFAKFFARRHWCVRRGWNDGTPIRHRIKIQSLSESETNTHGIGWLVRAIFDVLTMMCWTGWWRRISRFYSWKTVQAQRTNKRYFASYRRSDCRSSKATSSGHIHRARTHTHSHKPFCSAINFA